MKARKSCKEAYDLRSPITTFRITISGAISPFSERPFPPEMLRMENAFWKKAMN
ncbi:unnamed protein product [Linum tenue]|uniref:Uncharacterized protein n=1 Tax=Linum tenue TaxID=586396 RepID=A0AAV0R1Y1_9ROSI|nr:unnamed protein product [Linum tenue]